MKIPKIILDIGEDGLIESLLNNSNLTKNLIDLSLVGKTVTYTGDGSDEEILENGDVALIVGICPYFIQGTTTLKYEDEVRDALSDRSKISYLLLTDLGSISSVSLNDFEIKQEEVLQ